MVLTGYNHEKAKVRLIPKGECQSIPLSPTPHKYMLLSLLLWMMNLRLLLLRIRKLKLLLLRIGIAANRYKS
jgi:hypothetical protein